MDKNLENFSKIKEEIHKEGFEEGAAVLIGKKEEMPELRKKLETEGKTKDLGTYIKLHKEIILPINAPIFETLPNLKQKMETIKGQGAFWSSNVIKYIDKDGNYCRVEIDKNKIADLRDLPELKYEEEKKLMEEKLSELGFDLSKTNEFHKNWDAIVAVLRELEEKAKERKSKEFDF